MAPDPSPSWFNRKLRSIFRRDEAARSLQSLALIPSQQEVGLSPSLRDFWDVTSSPVLSHSRSYVFESSARRSHSPGPELREPSPTNSFWEPVLPAQPAVIPVPGPSAAEEKDCAICASSKMRTDFPFLPVSRGCNHRPGTCLACLQRWIHAAVTDKAWHDQVVTCPECNSAMEYNEVQLYADQATFAKYDARILNDFMSLRSDWFSCPSCRSGQIHDAVDGAPIVTCGNCTRKYCFRHRIPWHETMSCDEYDRFLADPFNFRSAFELENERAEQESEAMERRRREMEAADFRFAQSLLEDEEARAEAEARAIRDRAAREEAERLEAERKAARKRAAAAARAKAAKEAKRRANENAVSEATVRRTTKNCPACSSPIEKNDGW